MSPRGWSNSRSPRSPDRPSSPRRPPRSSAISPNSLARRSATPRSACPRCANRSRRCIRREAWRRARIKSSSPPAPSKRSTWSRSSSAASDACRANDAELLALPVDAEGADPKPIEPLSNATSPRAVYVAATYNNPTGTCLSQKRRERFIDLARKHHFTIIEDETLCDISLDAADPPAPIAALDRDAAVISIGSACKLFWGGLRIGWIRTSPDVIAQLYPLKTVADLGTSLVSQALTAELLPLRDQVRRERREQLRERFAVLEESLRRLLPDWDWVRPCGGSSLWIELPRGNAAAFAQFAARYDIKIAPGPVFSVADRHQRRLRLPFVLDPQELASGIERLTHVWTLYTPHSMTIAFDAVI